MNKQHAMIIIRELLVHFLQKQNFKSGDLLTKTILLPNDEPLYLDHPEIEEAIVILEHEKIIEVTKDSHFKITEKGALEFNNL